MVGPHWTLDKDHEAVTVSFPSSPPVALRMDAGQVDELIRVLGTYRAKMQPVPDMKLKPGSKVTAMRNPAWYTESDALMGDSSIHFRDLRFGWLHYLLPRDEARRLGKLLIQKADSPPPGPEQGRYS